MPFVVAQEVAPVPPLPSESVPEESTPVALDESAPAPKLVVIVPIKFTALLIVVDPVTANDVEVAPLNVAPPVALKLLLTVEEPLTANDVDVAPANVAPPVAFSAAAIVDELVTYNEPVVVPATKENVCPVMSPALLIVKRVVVE